MKAILSRRSIRHYTNQAVAEKTVTDILKAAMAAPSAGNQQPWHFIVMTERKILDEIPRFHQYAQMVLEAPLAILVCGDTSKEIHRGFWVQDCSAATENILIAVNDLGLGAVWVGVYPNEQRVNDFRKLLAIPQHIVPLALVSIGHPAEHKPPADRYDTERIHHNGWGL